MLTGRGAGRAVAVRERIRERRPDDEHRVRVWTVADADRGDAGPHPNRRPTGSAGDRHSGAAVLR